MKKATIKELRNGALSITGATTLKRYIELSQEDICKKVDGLFFAFTDEQFESGKEKAGIKEGEKVYRICSGGFASKEGLEQLKKAINDRNDLIKAECSAQEAYWYEYNNHECMLSPEGDYDAIANIISIFGIETAKQIDRVNALYPVEAIKV